MYALPRVLDLRDFTVSRDNEVAALYATLKKTRGKALGVRAQHRGLRRRTKSHNPYRHRLRPNKKKHFQGILIQKRKDQGLKPPRYLRRRPGALQAKIEESLRQRSSDLDALIQSARTGTDPSTPSPSTSTPYRLETHRWLVKRMKMKTHDGHVRPLGVYGRGHGRRSVIRALTGAKGVMEDVSYLQCIALEGRPSETLQLLQSCASSPADCRERLTKRGLAHHISNEAPSTSKPSTTATSAEFTVQLGDASWPPVTCLLTPPESPSSIHMLLVWIAPEKLRETVQFIAQRASEAKVGVSLRPVNLRRLELTGHGALKAALRILELAPSSSPPSPGAEFWHKAQSALTQSSASIQARQQGVVGEKRKADGPASGDLLSNKKQKKGAEGEKTKKMKKKAKPVVSPLVAQWKQLAPGASLFLPQVLDPRALRDRCHVVESGSTSTAPTLTLQDLVDDGPAHRPPPTSARSQLLNTRSQESILLKPLSAPPNPEADARVLNAKLPVLAVKGFRPSARPSLSLVLPSGWASIVFLQLVLEGVRPLGSREAAWVNETWP